MPLASIQPLQRLSLLEALAAQIEEWILSGELETGAKLPSEDSLSRHSESAARSCARRSRSCESAG